MRRRKSYATRWTVIISGILSSTSCGMLLYAFSVLVDPLHDYFSWTYSEITLAFAICSAISSLTCFPAGKLVDAIGPMPVTIIGGFLTGVGFFLSAFANSTFYFYLTYGCIAGVGSGLLYLPPLATVPKWWPSRTSISTGFAVVGLGVGSLIMGPLAIYILTDYGWRKVFLWCGILLFVMGIISGILVDNPIDYRSKFNHKIETGALSHKEVITSSLFWFLYGAFVCGESAGMMVISQLAPFAIEKGYSPTTSAWVVSIFATANAISRLLSGLLVEKVDLKKYFSLIMAFQALAIFFMYFLNCNFLILSCLVFVGGWGFGTMAVLFPSLTIQFFGKRSHASNYGLLLTACAIAGVLGPLVGSFSKDIVGSYLPAFLIGTILSAIASAILFLIRTPYSIKASKTTCEKKLQQRRI